MRERRRRLDRVAVVAIEGALERRRTHEGRLLVVLASARLGHLIKSRFG